MDEVKVMGKGEEGAVSKWMRGERFELGVLLPNSFRSAWMLWRGGVRRRLGYARDRRSWLLTDRVAALRKTAEQVRKDEGVRVAIGILRTEESIADGELVGVEIEGRVPRIFGVRVRQVFGVRLRQARAFVEHRMMSTGTVVRSTVIDVVDIPGRETALLADFQPVPTIEYYLELVRYLRSDGRISADSPVHAHRPAPLKTAGFVLDEARRAERRMELHVTEDERGEAEVALRELAIEKGFANLVVIIPGANFGASKCWMPERFAAVAEQLADPAGRFATRVLLAGSPAEGAICAAIVGAVRPELRERVGVLGQANAGKGVSIGALKEIVRQARLMICNDTGPRHIAAAFGVPTVTLFGPTDPVWAETFFEKERLVRVAVPCGPCQLKVCPIDHRCMKGITVEMVMGAVGEVWGLND